METVETKLDGRSREARALRSPMRSEDPRRDAAERAKQIMEHLGGLDGNAGEFDIDPSIIPDGWSYEWKQLTVLGAVDPSRQIELARNGWEPVPTARHPEMMPAGTAERNIVRKGMQLMERPEEVTSFRRNQEKRAASEQMRSKKEQIEGAPLGPFDRTNSGKPIAKGIKSTFAPMTIPD